MYLRVLHQKDLICYKPVTIRKLRGLNNPHSTGSAARIGLSLARTRRLPWFVYHFLAFMATKLTSVKSVKEMPALHKLAPSIEFYV